MKIPSCFKIDIDRAFSHLPNAPIVEAIIHWQVQPSKDLTELLKEDLEKCFSDYSASIQQQIEIEDTLSGKGIETRQRIRWGGFRLMSMDQKYICHVRPNAVAFSRLTPYEQWTNFVGKAFRFWDSFVECAAPVTVDRLGVRFVNQIPLKEGEDVTDVIKDTPAELMGFRIGTFFRHDTLDVPNHPYRVHLVRTLIQGVQPPEQRSLIVDIDVFTVGSINVGKETINQCLQEMRFLKNFVFFDFLKNAEERFK